MSTRLFLCHYCSFEISNFCKYLQHVWDKHSLQANFSIKCGIANCAAKYTSVRSFKIHIKTKHVWFYDEHFTTRKTRSFSGLSDSASADVTMSDVEEDGYDLGIHDDESSNECDTEETLDHDDLIADFLLELREKYHVTQAALKIVSEKVKHIIDLDGKVHVSKFEKSLKNNNSDFNLDYESRAILHCDSLFTRSLLKFSSSKALDQYITKKASYIAPEELTLGYNEVTHKFDHLYYVPILKTLGFLLKKNDIYAEVANSMKGTSGVLSNYHDGSCFKKNLLFSNDSTALQIIFYNDDFQCANPLGNKTSKYKVCAFYFTIGNLPPQHRSQLKDIHLVAVTQSTNVCRYGFGVVLQRFLSDINSLEIKGLEVNLAEISHLFFGTVSMVIADNLAAHALGCFYENFSTVDRFCRFCNMRMSVYQDKRFYEFQLRSTESYDNQARLVGSDPSLLKLYGVKKSSCLNCLKYFHVIEGLPPDPAHDLFEGFCIDFMTNVIVHFVKRKLFKISDVNDAIISFDYSDVDKNNKPQCLKEKSLTQFRVKLTACEMWNFLRLFPLMMGKFVDEGDHVWIVMVQLLEIVDRICSPSFQEVDLFHLDSLIKEFYDDYCIIFPGVALKPKSHFIFHYPDMIRKFGPLVKTLRFEAKNGFCKNVVANSKNYINLCKSIATHHQMYMYIWYKQENYLDKAMIPICSSEVDISLESPEMQRLLRLVLPEGTSFVSKSRGVTFNGQRYNTGSAVILDFANDEYVFGKIETIFYFADGPRLLCSKLNTVRFSNHYHAYVVEDESEMCLCRIQSLFDYHPLGMYRIARTIHIPLRYYVHEPVW